MRSEQEITDFTTSEILGEQITCGIKITKRFAHLLAFDEQVRAVQPVVHKMLAGLLQTSAFALGNLVLVMRENQIFAAHVDIEAGPEQFHAHCAALDVPAGSAFAPWTGPKYIAVVGHARLPQRKIRDRLFLVFITGNALATAHLLKIQF